MSYIYIHKISPCFIEPCQGIAKSNLEQISPSNGSPQNIDQHPAVKLAFSDGLGLSGPTCGASVAEYLPVEPPGVSANISLTVHVCVLCMGLIA